MTLHLKYIYEEISEEDRELFIYTKMSLLVHNGTTWVKKGDVNFDVTMGSFDGAEACDLVGLFLLSKLQHLPIKVGAYRDDVLAVCSLTPFQVEKVKQEVVEVFQQYDLKVKAIANTKVANFLDVTLDLNNKVHRPYMKPGTQLEYVHVNSNHPRHVTKHAVAETSKRLSNLSSNEAIFEAAKGPYEEALRRAGHKEKLMYQPTPRPGHGKHKSNFTHSAQRVKSSLAGHIWKLKDEGRQYTLKWRTLARLPTYNPSTNSCRLCLCEKFTIMFKPELASLNQRDEFFTHCRHREAKLLDKT